MRRTLNLLCMRWVRRANFCLLLTLLFVPPFLIALAPGGPSPIKREDGEVLNHHHNSNASFESAARRVLSGIRALGDEIDIHLFVLWHGAWHQRRRILEDIHNNFVVLAIAEYNWGAALLDGLWVLYSGKGGWARTGMRKKIEQCGSGAFLTVVVADVDPQYATKSTAHGLDVVSVRMHAKKKQYRQWSGGSGFRVHGTYNALEANHDVRVLFHETPTGLLAAPRLSDLAFQYLRDPALFRTRRAVFAPGTGGWTCDALHFALGAFARVLVSDAATGAELWALPTATKVKTVPSVPCKEWPKAIVLHSAQADRWGLVALLQAEPVEPHGDVGEDSAFSIQIEGSIHTMRLAML